MATPIRLVLALLMLAQAPFTQGCSKWVQQPLAETPVESREIDRIRITMLTGEQLILIDPSFEPDRISGFRPVIAEHQLHTRLEHGQQVVVTHGEIATFEVWTESASRTFFAEAALVSVVLLGILMASAGDWARGW